MTDVEKIISFETAKLAKEKGYMPGFINLEKLGFPVYKLGMGSYNANGEYAIRPYYNQTNPHYLAPEKQELQDWLCKNGILVLVDYEYECDSTPYFYKIYKFVDEHGKTERWPIEASIYEDDGTEMIDIVGYRNYKRSYGDYESYSDALDAGLQEALGMIEVKEKNIGDVTIREVNVKNGLYIENNKGTININ